jgi:16S rRNA (guanine966-N2)-methyltransferase
VRVISGILRGRIIEGYDISGTRPTMDRVKESLFAMIQNNIKDSICLDLFAGSGSLGIEAISNGAKHCYFVDNNKEAIKCINNNINKFKINDKCTTLLLDYKEALNRFKRENIKFDLIFLDPPYKDDIITDILDYIINNDMLNNNGQVICEYIKDRGINTSSGLNIAKERKYSDKFIRIYKKC